jgi:hypothetical protein
MNLEDAAWLYYYRRDLCTMPINARQHLLMCNTRTESCIVCTLVRVAIENRDPASEATTTPKKAA